MAAKDFFSSLSNYGLLKGFFYLKRVGLKKSLRHSFNLIRAKKTLIHSLPGEIQVLYVSVDPSSASHVYRVENQIDELEKSGIKSLWVTVDELLRTQEIPPNLKTIVCWRTALDINKILLFRLAQSQKVTIIYDTDDLTFDSISYKIEKVAGLQQIAVDQAIELTSSILSLKKKQIEESNYFVGSSKLLVSKAKPLTQHTYLLPNKLPGWMVEQAEQIREQSVLGFAPNDSFTKFVYPSGSNTHLDDFRSRTKVFLKFLEENPFTSLTILGFMDSFEIEKSFKRFGDRFKIVESVPHKQLLNNLKTFDVALAPLEQNSDFVRAKSAIRFFQAGILGIPTICSDEPEFREIIRPDINGWLASNDEDWLEALTESTNHKIRKSFGQNALVDTLRHQEMVSEIFWQSPIPKDVIEATKRDLQQHN